MPSYLRRESAHGGIEEFDTHPCKHCGGAVTIFLPPYTHVCNWECEKFGCDHIHYYCSRHQGILCQVCGELTYELGTCNPTREQIREEKLRRRSREANDWQAPRIIIPATADVAPEVEGVTVQHIRE